MKRAKVKVKPRCEERTGQCLVYQWTPDVDGKVQDKYNKEIKVSEKGFYRKATGLNRYIEDDPINILCDLESRSQRKRKTGYLSVHKILNVLK